MSRLRYGYESILNNIEKHPVRATVLTGLMGAKVVANCNLIAANWDATCDTTGLRGVLPNMLDVISHAGNVTVSIVGATLAAATASSIVGRLKHSSETVCTWRNRAALIVGTLAAAAVNTGLESIDSYTADPIDAVYGIGAGALAASMVKVEDPPTPATAPEE